MAPERRVETIAPQPAPGIGANPAPRDDACVQCGQLFGESDIFCPECGFVRPSAVAAPRPHDTVALEPLPWNGPPAESTGAPHAAPAPVAAPTPAPTPAPERADLERADLERADLEETRIVSRTRRGERFVLQFSTGESVTVFGTGLVGRHPVAEPGEHFDTYVTIVDPGKSVSKTHLEFGQDGGNFWVSDRFSGNGTVVREPEGQPKRCEPAKRYRTVRGSRVEIGEQFFIVS